MRSLTPCPAAWAREPAGFAGPFLETRLVPLAVPPPSVLSPQQSPRHRDRGVGSLTPLQKEAAKAALPQLEPCPDLQPALCPGTADIAFAATSPVPRLQIRVRPQSAGTALRARRWPSP